MSSSTWWTAPTLSGNLYLTTQLTEMGIPVVIALNMMDIVKKNGDQHRHQKAFRPAGLPR